MSSSAGKNGTCYARDECENKGGTGYGSCAGGYGVCCVCKLVSEFFMLFFRYFININVLLYHLYKMKLQIKSISFSYTDLWTNIHGKLFVLPKYGR